MFMILSVFLSVLAGLISSASSPSVSLRSDDVLEPLGMQEEQSFDSFMAQDEQSADTLTPVAPPVLEPLAVSRERYEAALNVPAAEYLGTTPSTTVQGLEVHMEEFDAFFPYIVLGLSLPEIPGFDRLSGASEFNQRAYLTVKNVLNRAGKNVYDAEHSFEEPPFNGIGLRPIDGLEGYLEGQRQVHVQKGVKETDLRSMEGAVVLELPVNVQAVEFSPSELGTEKKTKGASVSLSSIDESEYGFDYLGQGKNFIKFVGYDAEGKTVEIASRTADIEDALVAPEKISAAFREPVAKIKLFIADEVMVKSLPFTLRLEK